MAAATPKKYDLPITRVVFGPEEEAAILRPLRAGWVVQGPMVAQFEERFRAFTASAHAVATSSCTTALHLAVRALGLRAGEEVIVPAFTWVSTANVVEYERARPVFCDIDLATFNIDVAQLETLIGPRTVGIIPVHLFGLCADMPAILRVARARGLWVVEDAACAFGSWIGNTHAGTFGHAGCFSFHPRKSITTGEGGMVVCADAGLAASCRSLRDHGASRSDAQRHDARGAYLLSDYNSIGFNYRMTDLQGALGIAQMDRAEWILGRRRAIAATYSERLHDLRCLRRPGEPPDYIHAFQSYVALFQPEEPTLGNLARLHERRNRVMHELEDLGISTRQGTHAPVLLDAYRERYSLREEDYPNAVIADRLSLTLPLAAQMADADVANVVYELDRACAGS